jgi:hypothetical protein
MLCHNAIAPSDDHTRTIIMKNLRTLGIAGALVAAALVGGTLISAVLAAPSGSSAPKTTVPNTTTSSSAPSSVDAAKYCDLWQKTFAAQLGVSVDQLVPAAKAASKATIDAAVAAGDLPKDVGDRMKAEIDKADGNGCRLLGGAFHRLGQHAARVDFKVDVVGAAATALGLDKAALIKDVRNGDSLKKIAGDQGKDYGAVSKAIHDAAKTDLDALVTAGKMAQAREDAILTHLDTWLAAGGSFPRGGFMHPFTGPAATSTTPAS